MGATTILKKKTKRRKMNPEDKKAEAEREVLIKEKAGSLAYLNYSVDKYLEEKHAGVDAENYEMNLTPLSPVIAAMRNKTDPDDQKREAERQARIDAGFGCLAWMNYSVDEYLAEKYAEIERGNDW